MIPLRSEHWATPAPSSPAMSDGAGRLLNHLRFVATACRTKRRTDLFEACALLKVSRAATLEAHAEALMRCLAEALGTPARLYAPNAPDLSFDEAWLVQLARAIAHGDESSTAFLLHSRVARQHHRWVRYLMGRIASFFPLI